MSNVWLYVSRELTLSQWKYFFCRVRQKDFSSTVLLRDGEEIRFGCGTVGDIGKLNADYCNIRLAISHALHACGVANVITEIYGDDDGDEGYRRPVCLLLVDLLVPMTSDRLQT